MGLSRQVLNWGGRMEEMNIMLDKAEFIGMNMSLYYGIYNPSKLPRSNANRSLGVCQEA